VNRWLNIWWFGGWFILMPRDRALWHVVDARPGRTFPGFAVSRFCRFPVLPFPGRWAQVMNGF
jgi:hypothetical protein